MTAWATDRQVPVDRVVVEVGSALTGRRREFRALLGERSVKRIVVEQRDRLCRFGSGYVQAGLAGQAALAGQGRGLVVVDVVEVDDDGRRAARNRAGRALAAGASDGAEAV